MVLPHIPDNAALLVAVGIFGATVMPHAIYLHSGLTQARILPRTESEKRLLVRLSNREVIVALMVAGLVNMAIVLTASGALHAGHPDVAEIGTAYHTLVPLLGGAAAGVFLVSLLASGASGCDRRDSGRSNDHARLCRVSYSALGQTVSHDALLCCRRPGH